MSNFGFFDFLSFLLPGSVLIIIVYLICKTFNLNVPLEEQVSNFSETISIIAGVTLSYLIGHLVSFCRDALFKSKLSVASVLNLLKEKNEQKFLQLENINTLWFNKSLYSRKDAKLLDEENCDEFFSRSFNLLEAESKMGKVRVLHAQVLLFANLFFAFLIALLFLIVAFLLAKFQDINPKDLISESVVWGAVLSIVAWLSFFLISKRLRRFYNTVFDILIGWNDALRISKK